MADVRLIDANALDKILVQEYMMYNDVANALTLTGVQVYNAAIDTARSKIREANTIYADPVVHGRWMYGEDVDLVCSVCGKDALSDWTCQQICTDYCPHCGAKMKRGDGDV